MAHDEAPRIASSRSRIEVGEPVTRLMMQEHLLRHMELGFRGRVSRDERGMLLEEVDESICFGITGYVWEECIFSLAGKDR